MATPGELQAFVDQVESSAVPGGPGFAAPIQGSGPAKPFQRDLREFVADFDDSDPAGRQGNLTEFVENTEKGLLDELVSGASAGTDQLQMSLFALARQTGRDLNITELEDFGDRGIDRNIESLKLASPSVQSFSGIETMDDFFRWAAGSLGQASPSLAAAIASGGIGGIIGKKAIELKLKDLIKQRMLRNLGQRGVGREAAENAAEKALRSQAGIDMVRNGMSRGVSNTINLNRGFARGAQLGAFAVSAPPQSGQAALAGIDDPFLLAIVGLTGGALEALPALRLIDKMFPGVDRAISTNFIKDFAKTAGTQALLEGSTEGAQEFIQLAAMAYHDPNFDLLNPDNLTQIIDSFAAGALVGAVSGGGASAIGEGTLNVQEFTENVNNERPNIPEFKVPDVSPDGDFADNTLMQEISGRMNALMQETLGPALNTIRTSFQEGIDQVSRAAPALNDTMEALSRRAREAHDEFIEGHKPIIDDAVRYAKEQIEYIHEQAEQIIGDEERSKWIAEQLEEVRNQVNEVATQLRDRATKVADSVTSQVDGIGVFDDEFTNPQTTETDTDFIFGQVISEKNEQGNTVKRISRGEEAIPHKSRKRARLLIERLRKRFPSATDSTFGIREQEDGTFLVALEDSGQREALIEDEVVSQGVENARQSGRENPDTNRQAKVQQKGVAGQTIIDVPTLIFAGRKLGAGDNQTIEQGFSAMVAALLDRGIIGDDGAGALTDTFLKLYPLFQRQFGITQALKAVTPETRETALADEAQAVEDREQGIKRDEDGEILPDDDDGIDRRRFETDEQQAKRQSSASKARQKGAKETPKQQKARIKAEQKRDAAKKRRQKRRSKSSKAKPKRRSQPPNQEKLTGAGKVQVYLPGDPNVPGDKGVSGVVREAINSIANRVAKMLSPNQNIRIINRNAAMRMVQDEHEHAYIAEELLDSSRFAVKYQEGGPTYILVDNFEDAGVSIVGLIHELGHVLHYDTWAQLSEAEQDKLLNAFAKDVTSGNRTTGKRINRTQQKAHPKAQINNFEFREWMADQFVDWMNDRRAPKNAIERFMETVAQKLDKVWAFIKLNPGRFNQLNNTYADFVDAVALRVARDDPTGNNRWFLNEGAAGRPIHVLFDGAESVVPKGVTAREWSDMKIRMEEKYPAVAKRAATITQWLNNAYHLVGAPSTSVMRSLVNKGIKSADRLVNVFNRVEHGKPKLTRNYHQRIKLMKGQFINKFDNITRGMSDGDKLNLLNRMREMDGDPDATPKTLKERQLRKLFDDMHDYLAAQGLPVGKINNYFPRTFSREKLLASQEVIIAQLQATKNMTHEEARGFFNSLVSTEAEAAAALQEVQADELSMQSPSFRNMRSRTAKDALFDPYLENNLDSVVANYINAATKRGEYNRALGSKAPDGKIGGDRLPTSVWNPQGELDSILADAKKEGATPEDLKKMKDYVDANLGSYGRDTLTKLARGLGSSDPELTALRIRRAMATVVAYQNMRVLLFTVFASLPDIVGPSIRSGDMRGAFTSFVKNIKEISTDDNKLSEMARTFGIVSSVMNQHVLTEYVDSHYMPPGIRKWNDKFFQVTGLNWWTDFTRKAALATGIDTIKREAYKVSDRTLSQKQRDRAKQFLAELGINEDSVNVWVEQGERVWGGIGYDQESANDQQIAEALVQFVDESIMSPNASQRPILASHPAAMLIYHLKGFLFAMHDTVLKRLAHNFKIADTPAQVVAAITPALMMIALTAVGLELRELVTGNRRTDRMDGWEYTWLTVERSGLLGISQLGFDFEGAGARGQAELAAISGPLVGQLGDLISKPFSQTIPTAIPVVSQLPWARDALREATPL